MVVLVNEAYARRKRRWMAISVHTRTSLTSPLHPRDPRQRTPPPDNDDDDDEETHETVETVRNEEPRTYTTRLELSGQVELFVVNRLSG